MPPNAPPMPNMPAANLPGAVPPQAPPQQMPPQPIPPQQMPPGSAMQLNPAYAHTGMATASLVLGIVSLPASILNLLTLPIPVTAIVLGIISLNRKKSFALAGIVLGVIGLILSGVVLAVGLHIEHQKNANKLTPAASGGFSVDANCYSFALPSHFSQRDISKNSDCVTEIIKSDGSDDMAVESSSTAARVADKDMDAYLKSVMDEMRKKVGSNMNITSTKYIDLDGVRAYEAIGTETEANYKYGGMLVALSPRDYTSTSGTTLRGFVIAFDSSTSQTRLDEIVNSWHWK